MLSAAARDRGFRLLHRRETGSTNADALARAREGEHRRVWIVADRPTAGRGRAGRSWDSPVGNLHASLLLVDPCEPRRAPELGFMAGVALASAVSDVAGQGIELALKWPNDVLHRGAKLAGILVEGTQTRTGFAAVLGFGVNCASHPADLPYRATDLATLAPDGATRDALFGALSRRVAEGLALWAEGAGFAAVRQAWLARAVPRGTALAVARPEGRLAGRFSSIDADGRLILDTDRGLVTVEAGDVFLANGEMTAAS